MAAANKGYAPEILGKQVDLSPLDLGRSEISTIPDYEDVEDSDGESQYFETGTHPPL